MVIDVLRISSRDRTRTHIGSRIRVERKKRRWTLGHLSDTLAQLGKKVSASQLSRIETGQTPADLDELFLIGQAFNLSISSLMPLPSPPFCIVRQNTMNELAETIRTRGLVHKHLIASGVQTYVPLNEDALVQTEDWGGNHFSRQMQRYFVILTPASDTDMRTGLDSHPGVEILYVIEGEVEVWLSKPTCTDYNVVQRKLSAGDTLHLGAETLHAYRAAAGCFKAKALLIYTGKLRHPPY